MHVSYDGVVELLDQWNIGSLDYYATPCLKLLQNLEVSYVTVQVAYFSQFAQQDCVETAVDYESLYLGQM